MKRLITNSIIGSKLFSLMFLGLCASIGCAGLVHAQMVTGPVTVVTEPTSIVTTGGVTYAEYTWGMGGCLELDSIGPVIRNGSNFSFDFEFDVTGGACPQDLFTVSTSVPLGTLSPGDYTLTTTSWGVPVTTNTFTVPSNSTPTLQTIGFGTNGSFNIQLTGITNAIYVLQRSTNFVNWTSLSTNLVGPPLSDPSPILPGPCYYRVQILRN